MHRQQQPRASAIAEAVEHDELPQQRVAALPKVKLEPSGDERAERKKTQTTAASFRRREIRFF